MGKPQRTVYAFELSVNIAIGKGLDQLESFKKDFQKVISWLCSSSELEKKFEVPKNNTILYLSSCFTENDVNYIDFLSAKYNRVRNVIDTVNLEDKGLLKSKQDGDEEHTYICIKFISNFKAILFVENNRDGITVGNIIRYFNDMIEKYHIINNDIIRYTIECNALVSTDFLNNLEKLKRIKAVKLIIEQDDISISEAKMFAGKGDISEEIEILLKPAGRGQSIFTDTVKEFYKCYNDKEKRVKRVCIKGDSDRTGEISFNTEIMKEKHIVNIEISNTGEVVKESIYKSFKELVKDIDWEG